jgi:hypothetical protein
LLVGRPSLARGLDRIVGLQCDVPATVAGLLGLAAFFHDAGIWFDGTWDYLPPLVRRAVAELDKSGEPYSGISASRHDHAN